MARSETDSTIETGVMGVGDGGVCASVQNLGEEGGCTTHKPSWTLCEQLVRPQSFYFYLLLLLLFFIHGVLVSRHFRIVVWFVFLPSFSC